jgi:lipopolysaccharide export system permease protein
MLKRGEPVTLQRYIITEILKPAAAILIVLVIILASYSAITYLAQAVAGSLPPGTVGLLILLRIGMSLEVLLPTTFYLSVIIALGRLYKDSEMTALSACGVGITGVLKPVFMLSLPVAVLAGCASLYIRPESYEQIYRIMDQAQAEFDISRLEADNFLEIGNGKYVFFAEEVGNSQQGAQRVFIRLAEGDKRQVILAKRMIQGEADSNGQRVLLFREGTFYEFPVSGPQGTISRFEQAEYPLPAEAAGSSRYRRKAADTQDLLGSSRLDDIAELQWRLSTPLSTVLLALAGVPLSKSNPRRGKYAKLGVAIIIFAVYYQLFVIAKTWVEKAVVTPWLGIWWVPLLMALLAILLLWRTGEVFYRRPT